MAIYLDLNNNNGKQAIGTILVTYTEFSKVSGLVSNDSKTLYKVRFEDQNPGLIAIRDYLIAEYNTDINNIKYQNDEIRLLADTVSLGINESNYAYGYITTIIFENLRKIYKKTYRWHSNPFLFPNIF